MRVVSDGLDRAPVNFSAYLDHDGAQHRDFTEPLGFNGMSAEWRLLL
jgi:hypothetical protein